MVLERLVGKMLDDDDDDELDVDFVVLEGMVFVDVLELMLEFVLELVLEFEDMLLERMRDDVVMAVEPFVV